MRRVFRHVPLKYSAPVLAAIAILLIAPQILQNTKPTAVATATPQVADIGQTITFNATRSKGVIRDYEWIFHDGTIKHGPTVQHAFQKPGIYYVTLIVTADNGLTDLTTVKVVVKNDPPKAKITAKTIAYEGEEITFDASKTIDSDIDMPNLKYYWDFGDGCVAEGKVVSHTYKALEGEGFGYIKRTCQWVMWRVEGLRYGFCWYSLVAFLTNTSKYEHTPFSMNFYLAGNVAYGC